MSTEIFVINNSHHDCKLKLGHSKWHIHHNTVYSLDLPVSARKQLRYKTKHGRHTIAHVTIDHLGLVSSIKSLNKHFCVTTDGFNSNYCHSRKRPSIYISDK